MTTIQDGDGRSLARLAIATHRLLVGQQGEPEADLADRHDGGEGGQIGQRCIGDGLGWLLLRQLVDAGGQVRDVPAALAAQVRALSGSGHKTD